MGLLSVASLLVIIKFCWAQLNSNTPFLFQVALCPHLTFFFAYLRCSNILSSLIVASVCNRLLCYMQFHVSYFPSPWNRSYLQEWNLYLLPSCRLAFSALLGYILAVP